MNPTDDNNHVQRRTSSDGNISQTQSGETGSGSSEDSPETPFIIEMSFCVFVEINNKHNLYHVKYITA